MDGKRLRFFKAVLMVTAISLVSKLVMLQVVEAEYYRVLADENRVKLEIKRADRGIFYDRHGEVLVRNTPEGRDYLLGKSMAEILGYVGEVSEDELELKEQSYQLHDVIGKMGLEKQYDDLLRGEDGGLLVETGADGQVAREIGRKEQVTGKSLFLTIDAGLQKKASELMEDKIGALVVSEPLSGEVLALVSSPGFDPAKIDQYLNDPGLPLFNRAIGGEYPPGSTFKIVTATGALEDNKADETTLIEDTGEIRISDKWRYGNWYFDQYGRKEGELNIVRAIARSNDIFFYKMGEALGIEALVDWAKYFGLGQTTGIDLPGEANGMMPTPEWKKEFWGEDWFLGDTYISAIGQGNILMTPLQVNQMTSIIATKGMWCKPHLVKQEGDFKCQRLDISDDSIELVTKGMIEVCESGGTAWPLFDFTVKGKKIIVAGKTGTAEFGDKDNTETHAWFTGFAPADQPQLVITVLWEAAGEGSDKASPIAKELLEYWFSRQ